MSEQNLPSDSQQNINHNDIEHDFTLEDIKEPDKRRQDRLSGKNATYTWEEAKEIITERRKV